MALKNRCVACDYVIEAPDAMRGRETVCPACEAPNVLLSPDDAALRAGSASGPRPPAPAGSRAAQSLTLQAGTRLRDVSLYLLGFAYLILFLFLVLGTVLAVGLQASPAWRAVAFVGCALAGVFLYVYLKFMSDAVRALAELGRALIHRLTLLSDSVEDMAAARERDGSESS